MFIPVIVMIAGFALLIKGAEWLVSGASSLAKKYNTSDLVIGLTIVAFGTSTPEFVVNSIASFMGHDDIVYGNIIGSNNVNLFFALGIVGLIAPFSVQSSTVWKEIPISVFAAIVVLLLSNTLLGQENNILSRGEGILLLGLFGAFLYYVFSQIKNEPSVVQAEKAEVHIHKKNLTIWGLIIIGLGLLVIGGKLVVDNAITIATQMGVSQKIIGVTIVAIGTSLPEIVTSIVAAIRKNSDIAIGNIVGSNIFNLLFILAISALIRPIDYNLNFNVDLYFLIGGTALLFLAMFTGRAKRLDRWEAIILLILYTGYTAYLISQEF